MILAAVSWLDKGQDSEQKATALQDDSRSFEASACQPSPSLKTKQLSSVLPLPTFDIPEEASSTLAPREQDSLLNLSWLRARFCLSFVLFSPNFSLLDMEGSHEVVWHQASC